MAGMPGSGKTKTASTWGWLLDPRFSADDVSFTARGYINSLENIRVGSAKVWSEMGIGLPSRGWFQLSNILTAQVVQTMRIKKPIIFMDVSDLSFIDIQARKLIFHYSEVKRHKRNPPKVWLYNIKIDRKRGKPYYPHPLLRVGGKSVKLRNIVMQDILPDEIWKEIDKKQRKFKDRLERKALGSLRLLEKEEILSQKTIFDYINVVQRNKKRYINKRGELDWQLIQLHLQISRRKAQQIQKFLETAPSPP